MLAMTSVQAKVDRAAEHYAALDREVTAFTDDEGNRLACYPNADSTEWFSAFDWTAHPPDPQRWGLIAGDCFHAMRCALDHAVYALAVEAEGTDPPSKARELMFPISRTEDLYRRHGAWRVKSLPEKQRTTIEALQPYQGLDDPWTDPLLVLDDLDVIDKHRSLHVVVFHATQGNPTMKLPPGTSDRVSMEAEITTSPLKNRTPFMRVVFSEPTHNVEMEGEIGYQIALRHRGKPRELFSTLDLGFITVWSTIWALTEFKVDLPMSATDGRPIVELVDGLPVIKAPSHDDAPSGTQI